MDNFWYDLTGKLTQSIEEASKVLIEVNNYDILNFDEMAAQEDIDKNGDNFDYQRDSYSHNHNKVKNDENNFVNSSEEIERHYKLLDNNNFLKPSTSSQVILQDNHANFSTMKLVKQESVNPLESVSQSGQSNEVSGEVMPHDNHHSRKKPRKKKKQGSQQLDFFGLSTETTLNKIESHNDFGGSLVQQDLPLLVYDDIISVENQTKMDETSSDSLNSESTSVTRIFDKNGNSKTCVGKSSRHPLRFQRETQQSTNVLSFFDNLDDVELSPITTSLTISGTDIKKILFPEFLFNKNPNSKSLEKTVSDADEENKYHVVNSIQDTNIFLFKAESCVLLIGSQLVGVILYLIPQVKGLFCNLLAYCARFLVSNFDLLIPIV
jgi:hypothetical protein